MDKNCRSVKNGRNCRLSPRFGWNCTKPLFHCFSTGGVCSFFNRGLFVFHRTGMLVCLSTGSGCVSVHQGEGARREGVCFHWCVCVCFHECVCFHRGVSRFSLFVTGVVCFSLVFLFLSGALVGAKGASANWRERRKTALAGDNGV